MVTCQPKVAGRAIKTQEKIWSRRSEQVPGFQNWSRLTYLKSMRPVGSSGGNESNMVEWEQEPSTAYVVAKFHIPVPKLSCIAWSTQDL